jgi:hypothetical protein
LAKKVCNLSDENLIISLYPYPDNDFEASKDRWQRVTSLPRTNFRWINIDRRSNKRSANNGKLSYGTAHTTVHANGDPEKSVQLFSKIHGWMIGTLNQV